MKRRFAITLVVIPAVLCTSMALAQEASKAPVPPPPPPESPGNSIDSGGSQDSQKAAGEQESSDGAEKAGENSQDASESPSKLKFPVGGFKGKGLMGLPPLAIDKQLGLENAEANRGDQAAENRNVEANRNRRPQNAAGNAMPNNRMRVNPGMGNFGGIQPPVFMPGYNPNRPYGYPYGYYPSYPWRYYGYGHGVWNPGVIVRPSAPGASNYFGNPHGSQYFGNPHASQGVGRVGK